MANKEHELIWGEHTYIGFDNVTTSFAIDLCEVPDITW